MLPGIAIFGNGPLVHLLVHYFRANGFHIEAIWSPTAEQAQSLAAEHQIPVSSSVVDKILLLPSVQLIVIASAPHFHSQIASKACGIGKHVVCNWPPAYDSKEMVAMRTAAANYPALITLIFTALRFIPAFQLMRKLIVDDQLIGPVKTIQGSVLCDVLSIYEEKSIIWDKFMGGGLLSLFGTNLIDVITYTTGLRARKVHAMIRTFNQLTNHNILRNNADDFVNFQMQMSATQSGRPVDFDTQQSVVASVTLNGLHYSQAPSHELIVYGGNGYLVYRNGNLYGKLKQQQPATATANQSGPALPLENGHNSFGSSGQESVASVKESIFYLDDIEATSGDAASGKSSLASAAGSVTLRSHVWPEVYQRGIYRLIEALREAFFGGEVAINQANTGDETEAASTVHSMACQPASTSQPTSLNSTSGLPASEQVDEIHWIKEPVNSAANFDEGLYIQTVIEAIKHSAETQLWTRVDFVPTS